MSERLLLLAAAFVLAGTLVGSARAQAPIPDSARAEYMIKNTLVALNNANLTGNYTVLRDLGSPSFRANNEAARLAAIFAPLRDDGIDLAPIVVFQPQLTAPVASDENGRLRLVGQFPTRPLVVLFDLAYEPIGNRWMISDIAINTVPEAQTSQAQGEQDATGGEEGQERTLQPNQ